MLRRLYTLLPLLLIGTTGAFAQGPANPPVDVANPLVERIVDYDIFTGRFEPVEEVDISARVTGYLDAVAFEDGQTVEKGDLLFIIDPRTFAAAVDSARAQLSSARAGRDLARVERDRAVQLAERNVGSTQDADQAIAAFAQAEAEVAVAEAQLRSAELDLEFTEVRAPIAGRMSDRKMDVGNLVIGGNSGATVLSTVVSLDPIQFVFTASERDFLNYARLADLGERESSRDFATPIGIRLMDEEDFVHEGTIDFVDNRLDPNSGTISGRALVPNPGNFLTPGVFGRIRLPSSGEYDGILIPDEAILADQSRKLVFTVDAEGTVVPRPVVPGDLYRGLRVIRDGLGPDDVVIVNGVQRARPGQTVTPETVTLTLDEE